MDGRLFDDFLRDLSNSRRSLLGTALAAAGVITGLSVTEAKKKRKKCAKKCKDGCCTKKYGKCIKPAQQNATQCGTGGEICRSTGCGGGSDTCATTCEGCCAGSECIEAPTDDQCGNNGSTCVPCVGEEICAGECCVPPLKACSPGGTKCCGFGQCQDNTCCVFSDGSCTQDSDCCDPEGSESICKDNHCVVKLDMPCQPGWMCEGQFTCPAGNICDISKGCDAACSATGNCEEVTCFDRLYCCEPGVHVRCNVEETFCACVTEGGCH